MKRERKKLTEWEGKKINEILRKEKLDIKSEKENVCDKEKGKKWERTINYREKNIVKKGKKNIERLKTRKK